MPYRNIVWIKLEKRLLNDHRFYLMSENAQLIYVKLLLLAAETNNRIPKEPQILCNIFHTTLTPIIMTKCIDEIKTNFPKFRDYGKIYKVTEFMTRHNQIIPKVAQEYAGDIVDKRRDKNRIDIYIKTFSKRYKEITGVEYIVNYGKDIKLLKELLILEDKDVISLINEFFDSCQSSKEDVWWSDKLSIGVFKTVITNLVGRLQKK